VTIKIAIGPYRGFIATSTFQTDHLNFDANESNRNVLNLRPIGEQCEDGPGRGCSLAQLKGEAALRVAWRVLRGKPTAAAETR
jgi:hypothetical protein